MSRTPNTPAEGSGRRAPGALRRIAASRDAKMTLVLALVVVAALVLGMAYPALIQQFRVRPNQRTLEAPYIQRNIDATLEAYGLDDVDYQTNYDAATTASAASMQKGG